ncbi:MAG: SUMF1/EgtB/PvdO family nonheme iron enzyme [Nannocystaceae bacterium]
MLTIDLPSGVTLGLDGEPLLPTPVPPINVTPGKHVLSIKTGCQQLEIEVDAPANETTIIDRARVPELAIGTLEVRTRDRDGNRLAHDVQLDGAVVNEGNGVSTTAVPACKYRVRIAGAGVGGVVEDIDFGKDPQVRREVILAPGPDMVRLHGGRFPLASSPRSSEMAGFDLDRTEVTADQWMKCRRSGGCEEDRQRFWWGRLPKVNLGVRCNVDFSTPEPTVEVGRGNHPMNCIAPWEAEAYCRWAGKRLPTDQEWVFAATGGKPGYRYPWGRDEALCGKGSGGRGGAPCSFIEDDTSEPCSRPETNTEQGVCDMMGNVYDIVDFHDLHGGNCKDYGYDPGVTGVFDSGYKGQQLQYSMGPPRGTRTPCYVYVNGSWDIARELGRTGFRCARDIEDPAADGKPPAQDDGAEVGTR